MRIPRSPSLLGASLCALGLLLAAPAVRAQEPPPAPAPTPAPAEQRPAGQPAGQPGEQPAADPGAADAPRRQRRPGRLPPGFAPLVLEAGHVHPVTGPAIENGVVVVRGERIVAVGKKGEVEVPQGAIVRSFPTGHVYPGLIDAATDAYTDGSLRSDGGADGGTSFADDLRKQEARFHDLAAHGITTAYVTVRSPAFVRGQGAIVRPKKDGAFEPWRDKEAAALQMRLASGTLMSHALERQQQFQQADGLFEGLDEYRKSFTDHADALKKYDKEFADYLAFHQKKKDGDKKPEAKPEGAPAGEKAGDKPAAEKAGEKPTTPPAGDGPQPGGEGRRRRGGPPREEPPKAPGAAGEAAGESAGESASQAELERAFADLLTMALETQDPPKPEPAKQEPGKPEAKPGEQGPQGQGGATAEKKDEGPKRPTYPKAPPKDPQKDALLAVLDGDLPLRVEAHRADELRAALQLQRTREIPLLVLEQAYGADAVVKQMTQQSVSVVLTEVLPMTMPAPYDAFDPSLLPKHLHDAGVPFAIASGTARLSSALPLLAATAVGRGLPADQALRAITLSAAEILGVAKETGSLQKDKFADVLVTDRPLFASDSRVLLVLQKGKTEFEAK
jgi:imidazolonepropionase-like amidohydrolase